jgi:hypothetical protein
MEEAGPQLIFKGGCVPGRNSRKLNQPMFSLWIAVAIVLRHSFESLHRVLKHIFNVSIGRADSPSPIATSHSSCDGKIIPCRQCFTCMTKKKSSGARSGECGGCVVSCRPFSAQKARYFSAVWEIVPSDVTDIPNTRQSPFHGA